MYTFNYVCAPDTGNGSCELAAVEPVSCMDPLAAWPPGGGGGGGGGTSCPSESFDCNGKSPNAEQPLLKKGSQCCCNWGFVSNAGHTACVAS